MAQFYFPEEENLTPFTAGQTEAVRKAVALLQEANLSCDWEPSTSGLSFLCDGGMTAENGVMGYVSYLRPRRILIARFVAEQLTWESRGVPNNEFAMAIVVHELTHVKQRKWWRGLAWPILNIPGIDRLTLEKWAVRNQTAAEDYLRDRYSAMRRGIENN